MGYWNYYYATLNKLQSSKERINTLQIENNHLKYDRQQYQNEIQGKNKLERDLINCQSRLKQLQTENQRLEDEKQADINKKSTYKSDLNQIALKLRVCEERYNTLIKCELICCLQRFIILCTFIWFA